MCGRYAVFLDEESREISEIINEVNERYKNSQELGKMKTGEIFPTDIAPVITSNSNNKKVANIFKWGFPSFKQQGGVIINAKSETITEKPMFRNSFLERRCLIPANEYYEWRNGAQKKEKFKINILETKMFYMAGIYNQFKDKNNDVFTGFVIITTSSNEALKNIHDRMPVIIKAGFENTWLDGKNSTSELIGSLITYEDKYIKYELQT